MKGQNLSHKHDMILSQGEEGECFQCGLPILCDREEDIVYICRDSYCSFIIHESCANWPLEIKHLFHPQHPLTWAGPSKLLKERPSWCNACRKFSAGGFTYSCLECQSFELHINCGLLLMSTEESRVSDQVEHKIQHVSGHPHPLILCDKKNNFHVSCSACGQIIIGSVHACIQCQAFLHESCAQLPTEIEHPFHPIHPLTLHPEPPFVESEVRYCCCNACGEICYSFSYHCSLCKFNLHVKCASLMPTNNNECHEHQVPQLPTHPLIASHSNMKLDFSCSACKLPIEGMVYVCLECNMSLHKSCAKLPQKVNHPFHPLHPLILRVDAAGPLGSFCCNACTAHSEGFRYSCGECDFHMDIKCASVRPNIWIENHSHPFAFFKRPVFLCHKGCSICDSVFIVPLLRTPKEMDVGFLHCVQCDIFIHVHCLEKVPHTIKHKCHLHPLTFTDSPVMGYPYKYHTKFYCDACEQLRNRSDCSFYCSNCYFVAHVSCVIPELLPFLNSKLASSYKLGDTNLDKSIDVAEEYDPTLETDAEILAAHAEVEALTMSLNALQAKLEVLANTCATSPQNLMNTQ